VRASREQANLLRARLQSHRSIVEGRGAGAQNGDLAAFETREVDVIRGMKHAHLAGFKCGSQRGERRRVGGAGAIPPASQHHLAGVYCFGALRAFQLDTDEVRRGVDIQRLRAVLDGNFGRIAHPKQVREPIGGGDLVEALPALGAVLRFVPGAKGERRKAEIGPGQVLGRAQYLHACISAPGALAATRRTVDDARIAHAVAGERQC